jgi:hypothetical protein
LVSGKLGETGILKTNPFPPRTIDLTQTDNRMNSTTTDNRKMAESVVWFHMEKYIANKNYKDFQINMIQSVYPSKIDVFVICFPNQINNGIMENITKETAIRTIVKICEMLDGGEFDEMD